MGNEEDAERFDEVLRGPTNLTGAINTAEYRTQFAIQPGNEWPARGYDDTNVWYEENGGDVTSLKPKATLAELTTDGAQTDSKVAVESPTLVYRPGSELSASAGVFVDVMPTGDAKYEILFGREPRTVTDALTGDTFDVGKEYAGLRIVDGVGDRDHDLQFVVGTDPEGDGTATERVIDITAGDWEAEEFIGEFDTEPKAIAYGKDPLDGGGPSNITFDARKGFTYGIEIGWYAPTSLVPYIIDTVSKGGTYKQRRHPILIYNPTDGPAIQRPNQPVRVVAHNGTSGDDLKARLGGRAGAYSGEAVIEPTPVNHNVYNQDVGTGSTESTTGTQGLEWYVVAVAKPRASDPDAVVSPRPPTWSVTNDATAMVRVVHESDITGTIQYDEPANVPRSQTEVAIDAVEDTPDRLSIDTITDDDGETKMAGVKVGNGLLAAGGKNKAALTETETDFGITIPRDLVFVYMVAARAGSSLTVDASYNFINTG